MTYYIIVLIITLLVLAFIIFCVNEKQRWAGITILATIVLLFFGASYDIGHYRGKLYGDKKVEQADEEQESLRSSTIDQTINSIACVLPAQGGKDYKVIGKTNAGLFILTANNESEAKVYQIPDGLRWENLKVGTTLTYNPHSRSWSIGSF